ncbi:hypothetical protein Gogos_015549 [Gossypium gossypioides]|uniref:Uncharacterized protein n=1 Tax=Gossypium gossypioides TaxID=34282 RepID=A0A7J9C282_GOSGO|nr:hypothetical protein [Gossypium gossypioides]
MRGLVFDIKSEILHWGVLKLGSLVVFVSKIAIHLTKLGFVDIGKPNCINNFVVPVFIVIVAVIAEVMPTSAVTSAHTCFLQFSNWFMKKKVIVRKKIMVGFWIQTIVKRQKRMENTRSAATTTPKILPSLREKERFRKDYKRETRDLSKGITGNQAEEWGTKGYRKLGEN